MSNLILTARSEARNKRHTWIGVFCNGGKAGVLTVETEHEQAVLDAINAHSGLPGAQLLDACKFADEMMKLRAAAIKARGESP